MPVTFRAFGPVSAASVLVALSAASCNTSTMHISSSDLVEQGATRPVVCPYPWSPDNGDGTYSNPVLCADYSDPDVIRDGKDFWLTASSFTNTPGLPILHSTDLVNWKIVNHALKNLPDESYGAFRPGCGVWAPAIRKHGGTFYIFYPTPDEGIFVVTADRPDGAWSEPHCLIAGKGLIDPCPLWDDDGKAYLVHAYAGSRAGIKNRLRVRPMAPDASQLLGEGVEVYNNPEKHPTLEGPKFLKKDGWYYISAPAGGVPTGWQVIFRSRNPYGPYEDRIVLRQGATPVNGPHQGALLDDTAGNWWFVHFQDADAYGRITHLQPVTWRADGWPVIGSDPGNTGCGVPFARHAMPAGASGVAVPQTSDEFEGPKLGLQWQWTANHEDGWAKLENGSLRLSGYAFMAGSIGAAPSLLTQKLPATAFTVETAVRTENAEVSAGLVLTGKHTAALMLTNGKAEMIVDDKVKESWDVGPRARLRLRVGQGGAAQFSFVGEDGAEVRAATPFQAVKGQWIGARVGVVAKGQGFADFGYFRFGKP